ncbi:unnamed protein product, partial [Closterium sp. Naga37s-1]
ALQLQPRWAKAYSRIAVAHYGMKRHRHHTRRGFKCDSHSTVCKQGLQQVTSRQKRDEFQAIESSFEAPQN